MQRMAMRAPRIRPQDGQLTRCLGWVLFPVAAAMAGATPASAQGAASISWTERVVERDGTGAVAEEDRFTGPLIQHDGPYVVIRLAENRLSLVDGDRVVWSAPVGTGTGFRLNGERHQWTFSTPLGLFKVQRKEKDPVWEAPDWYYVERGMPIPAEHSASRQMPGVMGSTALYLGDGIAIHGTNSPELILNPDPEQRRVSHGCIRLTNEAARTLYHLVDVGTPVLIY